MEAETLKHALLRQIENLAPMTITTIPQTRRCRRILKRRGPCH